MSSQTSKHCHASSPADVPSDSELSYVDRSDVPRKKRPRTQPSEPGSADEAVDTDAGRSDGDDASTEAAEQGVEAVAARVKQVGTSGRKKISAIEKKQKFQARFAGISAEDILKQLASGWRSQVYQHFRVLVILPPRADGTVLHRFVCQRQPSKHVDCADYEDSTGNLRRHILGCDPEDTPEVAAITAFAQGSTYSLARVRFLVALWCACRHRPYIIVEDPEFRQLMVMLYGRVQLPTRMTVSRDVQLIHSHCKARVLKHFESLSGRVHVCIDGWTSPNVISFLGITAHWHEEGVIKHIILDFVKLTKSHTGKYLAECVIRSLRDFGIEKQVLAVTCNNAESNTVMLREMHVLEPTFRGPAIRVRCFGHVLNLVVKAILSIFSKPRRVTSGENASQDGPGSRGDHIDDDDNNDDAEEATFDEDATQAAQEIDQDREAADDLVIKGLKDEDLTFDLSPGDIDDGRVALDKILSLSGKVWNSPHVRSELAKLSEEHGLESEVLVRAVRTHWNTVTEVLKRAIDMKEVLGALCDMHQFNKNSRGPRLRRFLLSDSEWDVLEELHRLLDPFLYATKQISVSERALVQDVIPYIDVLTQHIDTFHEDASLSPMVRVAAKRGRAILDKYYKHTDDTMIYRVAMILHPKYKLQYFRDQEWDEEWITEALRLIRDEWTTYYKPKDAPAGGNAGKRKSNGPTGANAGPGRRSAQESQQSTRALFASIAGSGKAAKQDALEVYLEAPQQPSIKNPLEYWNLTLKTSDSALAKMALDFLSIPSTSTDAERAFSHGHLTVSHLRHSLADESVRASTMLGSWSGHAELVPEGEVVDLLRATGKEKRSKLPVGPAAAAASTVTTADVTGSAVAGPSGLSAAAWKPKTATTSSKMKATSASARKPRPSQPGDISSSETVDLTGLL